MTALGVRSNFSLPVGRAGVGLFLVFFVYLVPFYVYCRERTCRTQVLAGTTANTTLLVDSRNKWVVLVVVKVNHLDGSRRTMALTVATFSLTSHGNTVLAYPYGMTNLCG